MVPMGMVNYLMGKFVFNLSQITSPLRDMLKKNFIFADLQQPQLIAIQEIKKIITSLQWWQSAYLDWNSWSENR